MWMRCIKSAGRRTNIATKVTIEQRVIRSQDRQILYQIGTADCDLYGTVTVITATYRIPQSSWSTNSSDLSGGCHESCAQALRRHSRHSRLPPCIVGTRQANA